MDTTISRTFKIKPVKGKPTKSVLKTRPFQKRKFRTYQLVKGIKKPLKNTFIERKGKFLIDSLGEKRGLTLRRGLAKLRKESRIEPIKRKPIRQITPRAISKPKRKVSQATLDILKAGREKRLANLKKRK